MERVLTLLCALSEKQNWPYFIQEPHKARIGIKSYAANYNHSPSKLRIHHTK